jgi:hypothetical protein
VFQAIWYICRRVLQPPQEAHLYTAAVSLGAPPDILSFAEVRPLRNPYLWYVSKPFTLDHHRAHL